MTRKGAHGAPIQDTEVSEDGYKEPNVKTLKVVIEEEEEGVMGIGNTYDDKDTKFLSTH